MAANSRVMLYGMAAATAVVVGVVALFLMPYTWTIVPASAYVVSFALNIATKYVACDRVDFVSSAKMALIPMFTALLIVGLLGRFDGMKSPIFALLPGLDPDTVDSIGNMFYVFWFVFYGQLVSGGLQQICGAW